MKNIKCLLIICTILCGFTFCKVNCISTLTNSQNEIVGKWKLIKEVSGRTVQGNIAYTYDTVDVIFEFKSNNVLAVQCLRQDNNCSPYQNGDYSYKFKNNGDSWHDTKIEIGNHSWWYRVSEKELELTQSPVDGGSYIFEKLIQQTDSVTTNNVCSQCNDTTILAVLEDAPAYLRRGCYEEIDSFYIVLTNQQRTVYPCNGVPEEFKVESLRVLVSGNILNCGKGNLCFPSRPEIRIAATHIFELKNIKHTTQ